MSDWVTPDIPSFAVVGRVNMGKSSVLATLLEIDDNDLVRISATPGETTRCQIHRVVFGGRECVRFIDTPGFSRPVEAMRFIRGMHGDGSPDLATLRRFIADTRHTFEDERRLLAPLVEGAGVLYIIDPALPLRDDFLAEMEILRWTGRPRLAVLNRRGDNAATHEDEWKNRLGGTFNLTRSFDAHRARFHERLRLFTALLDIDEAHKPALEETVRLLNDEWRLRREESAEALLGFLEEALGLTVSATLEERDLTLPARRERKATELTKNYFAKLSKLEDACARKLLKIYRHHLLTTDTEPTRYQGIDLESDESWSKWGLSRGQLSMIGALVGGAAGLTLDVGTGGLSHGIGALLGGLGAGAAAWLKGGELPDLRIDLTGGVKLATGEGRSLSVGPPRNPNFPWILLDSMLVRQQAILARAHGRRDPEQLTGEGRGFTRNLPSARRSVLAKWFSSCLKKSPNRGLEPDVFNALVETLEEMETANDR